MRDSYNIRYVVDGDYDSTRWRTFTYPFSADYTYAAYYPDYYYRVWDYTCIDLAAAIIQQVRHVHRPGCSHHPAGETRASTSPQSSSSR